MAACVLENKSRPKVCALFPTSRNGSSGLSGKVARGLERYLHRWWTVIFHFPVRCFSELHNIVMPNQISREEWSRAFKASRNFMNKLSDYTETFRKRCGECILSNKKRIPAQTWRLRRGTLSFIYEPLKINYSLPIKQTLNLHLISRVWRN